MVIEVASNFPVFFVIFNSVVAQRYGTSLGGPKIAHIRINNYIQFIFVGMEASKHQEHTGYLWLAGMMTAKSISKKGEMKMDAPLYVFVSDINFMSAILDTTQYVI